ncbi:MAG: DUF58 domain-containing protein [Solirubrobacterales bacterium]|nr:DUF58 domain-containing protein [Solirubrobacterales bacterium]
MKRAAGIVAAGGLLILVAYTFATPELLVPGIGLALLAAFTGPWVLGAAHGAQLRRSIESDRVVEDQPLEARIEVRGGWLGLPGAEVLDSLAGATVRLLGTSGRRATEVRVVGRFPRRGRHRLEPPALALSDPLGLVQVVRSSRTGSQTLLVLPKTERLRWLSGDGGDRLARPAGAAQLEMLAALEVDGLRPYRPGTPASRIHWSALARGAGLLERRLRAERDAGPLVVLDLRSDGPVDDIDAAVRAAASLTLQLARRAGCELLLPGDRRPVHVEPDLGSWPAAHARLALVEGGPDVPPPWAPARARSGAVFYVAAQAGRLSTRLQRGASGGLVLVLPAAVAPTRRAIPSFEVSGCRGYLLAEGGRLTAAQGQAA